MSRGPPRKDRELNQHSGVLKNQTGVSEISGKKKTKPIGYSLQKLAILRGVHPFSDTFQPSFTIPSGNLT